MAPELYILSSAGLDHVSHIGAGVLLALTLMPSKYNQKKQQLKIGTLVMLFPLIYNYLESVHYVL